MTDVLRKESQYDSTVANSGSFRALIHIDPYHASVTLINNPFFQKTKIIIEFVTSIIVKMQSFNEIGQKLAKM